MDDDHQDSWISALGNLIGLLAVPAIAFAGVIALLPRSWIRDETGSITGFGFFLVVFILIGLLVFVQNRRSD